ncbi:ATP-binding protein [Dyella tabacisoli]|uniref:ATP-binding protein n=1 Tax=Dyella tabacisoli TaxID=2282381 RepID=A0A369UTZ0_9GAMM|nr:ATP-binding protein [Dyella tabacisoli]RDD83070.1 ATP-binding protein [Dyella tabacisoli]
MTLAPALYPTTLLARLDRLIEREVLRLRARYQLSLDEFRGLYISDAQIDEVIAQAYANADLTDTRLADLYTDATADSRGERDPRWEHMCRVFQLSTLEEDLVLIALAPELDLKYETLYAYLNNDVTRKWPTTDLARRLLGDAACYASDVDAALAPAARLRTAGIVHMIDPPGMRPSLLNAGFAPNIALVRYLFGAASASSQQSQGHTSPSDPAHAGDASPDDPLLQRLTELFSSTGTSEAPDEPPVLVIQAATRYEREALAAALAQRLALPWRSIDISALRRDGRPLQATLEQSVFECRLETALILIEGAETLAERDGQLAPELAGLLDLPIAPLLLAAQPHTPWRSLLGQRRALSLSLGSPPFAMRVALWKKAAPTISAQDCAVLAERFAFSARQIHAAVADARDLRILHGLPAVDAKLLRSAARQQMQNHLGALASKVECKLGWDDLVLPEEILQRLREIAAAIRYRHRVYHEWGFLSGGMGGGMKILFAGASGTGKTMTAGVIAHELDLDLYRIDLSGVVSKYIGDTEKNLDRIFTAASTHNAVLFFDEADAMFGKRSEVKDAHDRYANIEVAYLLQKLEEHAGIVVLASNFKRNIDEAFARRMHYVVDFPKPDAQQRERLWRRMFPAQAPLERDIDFAFLARQFELPGGDIRTISLDAAFLAAQEQAAIGMSHLVRALARQLAKQGSTPSPTDFKHYHPLLRH